MRVGTNRYGLADLRGDAWAASVAAFATLPQGFAYGLIALAPLGPEWAGFGVLSGIGTAMLFTFITGTFASNPFLISGPRAMTALVIATMVGEADLRDLAPQTAILLGFLGVTVAGALQLVAGLCRVGKIVAYMPVPVLAGFVSASAIIFFLSALPLALGYPLLSSSAALIAFAERPDFWALAVSGGTVALTFGLKNRIRVIPASLAALVLGSLAYILLTRFAGLPPGPVVGSISPPELLRWPVVELAPLWYAELPAHLDIPLLGGISIALLTSFDTVLSGQALDQMTQRQSRVDTDLRWHGIANIAMGLFAFLPGSPTMGRSIAAFRSGAVTRLANAGSGIIFAAMLTVLAPLVSELPIWAAAGMLMATAVQSMDRTTLEKIRMIAMREFPHGRVLVGDVLISLLVVIIAVAFDIIAAVGVGMLVAILLFVLGMGRDPVRRAYLCDRVHANVVRSMEQVEFLEREGRRIAVIELQGALFFGACIRLQAQARSRLDQGAVYLILDFRHLTSIDSTGCETILALQRQAAEVGGRVLLSCLERERRLRSNTGDVPLPAGRNRRSHRENYRWIWLSLTANGVIRQIGNDAVFDDTDLAKAHCEELLLAQRTSRRTIRKGRIASAPILDDIDRSNLPVLGGYFRVHRFAPGEAVFSQGDCGDRAFFLLYGRMDVLIDIPGSSRRRRVSALAQGAVFGEMGLLDGEPRSAHVIATRRSLCLFVDRQAFLRLEADHPDLVLKLLRNLNRQFSIRLRLANLMISELER